jgi:hypothetical protein
MDAITSATTQIASTQQSSEVNTALLKKSQDLAQAQSQQLLQAIPQPANMPNQGQKLDVKA